MYTTNPNNNESRSKATSIIDEFLSFDSNPQGGEKLDQFCNMMKFFMHQNPDMMNSMMNSVMNNSGISHDANVQQPEPITQSKPKQKSAWVEENRIYENPSTTINPKNEDNDILSGYLPTDRNEEEVKPQTKRDNFVR